MEPSELDDTDRQLLHLLQEDARNSTASALADELGVAPNTVRNRIARLEDEGIIRGYHPDIDYAQAGFQLHVLFVCTVPVSDRTNFADQAFGVEGVVQVTEILSGDHNLVIEVVGSDADNLTQIAMELEGTGITIRDERFIKNIRTQPFNHFGRDV